MVRITGDIHGYIPRIKQIAYTSVEPTDTIILLGDVGVNFHFNERDIRAKKLLSGCGCDVLCVHGNHEEYPMNIDSYEVKIWNNGLVFYEPEYPNLLFAVDGMAYTIEGQRYFVLGGAYSVDKDFRLENHYPWFESEQMPEYLRNNVLNYIEEGLITDYDFILSHTCPKKYIPTEMFLNYVDQSTVDDTTERFLNEIESKVGYKAWFCGHWHVDKTVDNIYFLFNGWKKIDSKGEIR